MYHILYAGRPANNLPRGETFGMLPSTIAVAYVLCVTASAVASAQGDEFFERRVRPILVENCLSCHGVEKQESGLRLDSRTAILIGGDRGPAATPGNAVDSLLVRAIEYHDDDLRMPPSGKLSPSQTEILRAWIAQGAMWPADMAPVERNPNMAERGAEMRASHWAFQPIRRPSLPEVNDVTWGQSPLDCFILARLEKAGLSPSPAADRPALLRRVYLDLLGLPPTADEMDQFAQDDAPDAYERLVNQLLERPEYGQHWARHWLDVARYADTKGYVDGAQSRYPFAYTYRDYVVRAFNEDVPYDQFVMQQLAADRLPIEEGQEWKLAAMGFLTVGRRFNVNIPDVIDDRIDVITRGLMGLTVSCARCHDHKYDPIPTADYYALYGVLASSVEPPTGDLPLLSQPPDDGGEYREYLERLSQAQRAYEDRERELHETIAHELRAYAADYLVYLVREVPRHRQGDQNPLKTARTILRGPSAYGYGAINRWRRYVQHCADDDPVFGLWQRLIRLPAEDFPNAAAELIARDATSNPRLLAAVRQSPPASMSDFASKLGGLLEDTYAAWQAQVKQQSDAVRFADEAQEELRQVLYGPNSPAVMTAFDSVDCYRLDEHTDIRSRWGKIEAVSLDYEHAPARAMLLVDRSQPIEPRVFLRGNANRPGARVPRRFLTLLRHATGDQEYHCGSGRLEMARAIASHDNPLTARVLVNRVWAWHFGRGLVATTSDFGLRSAEPTHPELLDYLATWFMDHGWSLKELHRLIMTSSTYRQASQSREAGAWIDPENLLLWKFPRQRMDLEVLRDSLLRVSARLDHRLAGKPVAAAWDDPSCRRRSIYLLIDRQHMPELTQVFDFPSPDMSSPGRTRTTVPQQQLFMMNNRFVTATAEALVAEMNQNIDSSDERSRLNYLYRQVFARDASPHELDVAVAYLRNEPEQEAAQQVDLPSQHWQYGFGSYDRQRHVVTEFTELPYFDGSSWQGGPDWPDPELHYLRLTSDGGHVGIDPQHAAIRRWISPTSGLIAMRGRLLHGVDGETCGDGIEAWIVSSRHGQLGQWQLHAGQAETGIAAVSVQEGDTIDFVVSCRDDHFCDLFAWAPAIQQQREGGDGQVWDAKEDFAGPVQPPEPLDVWTKIAQVLLQSNEFLFID